MTDTLTVTPGIFSCPSLMRL